MVIRGRGAAGNPDNRFERISTNYDPDPETGQQPSPARKIYRDDTAGIISVNRSPDIPFNKSLNPYRGCEHGCIYCYARPTHEYLGFSAGLDFESRIIVKYEAPELLRKQLCSRNWKPETLAMSGVTDPYQPLEKDLEITRRCIAVLAEARHPLVIITKNHLVTRDLDLFRRLAAFNAVRVVISVTTLERTLGRIMEPRTSSPKCRIEAIRGLSGAGVPVHVNVAPVIPGLTDHEIPGILRTAAQAGAETAGYTLLRLPYGVKDLFTAWLEEHFPDRRDKVLNRIRRMRGGNLNRSEFGLRFRGDGPFAKQVETLYCQGCRRHRLNRKRPALSTEMFRRPVEGQTELF